MPAVESASRGGPSRPPTQTPGASSSGIGPGERDPVGVNSPRQTAAEALSGADKPSETLSQFVARVLDQLSLSAWLPSAALVLATALLLQLGTSLDETRASQDFRDDGAGAVIAATLSALADLELGAALLVLLAIVVLTILTQAFAFESIRVLEGYWGANPLVEVLAGRRASAYRRRRERVEKRQREMRAQSWRAARAEIERQQSIALERGEQAEVAGWDPEMLTYVGAKLLGQASSVRLQGDRRAQALSIPWKRYAPADLMRREVNLDRRLRDLPASGRTLPTKLGNVLRAHEDQTGRDRVETMVLEVYESLDPILRRQHDEHRNRLDLYCSMVFVMLAVGLLAVGRLVPSAHTWAAAATLLCAVAAWLSYRAAVASARVYGLLIVEIARRYPAPENPSSA